MGLHDSNRKMSEPEIKMREEKGVDYSALAESVDEIREMVRAFVAGLVADGFTDREARMIVAGAIGSRTTEVKRDE